jgi:D-alanyl-D-alanine carboxypeptidase/D-alanyl-D-alanine-endopeptidase (penicillin-binding protein 4)
VAILTSSPSRATVAAGLPVAAQSGTLYRRFLATPVAGHLRAKTGSIRATTTLAGYADAADGSTLTFAFLQNGVGPTEGRDLQDALGHDLVVQRP